MEGLTGYPEHGWRCVDVLELAVRHQLNVPGSDAFIVFHHLLSNSPLDGSFT